MWIRDIIFIDMCVCKDTLNDFKRFTFQKGFLSVEWVELIGMSVVIKA